MHVLVRSGGSIHPKLETYLEGVLVVFRSSSLRDGSVTMIASLPTDTTRRSWGT